MPATQWDTESTRLLCAAILVDRDLPNRLLRESKAAPRALPAATDVDLATATCCAIVELRRRRVRDGLLAACCALLAVGLIGSIIGDHKLWVLILVSLLVAWVVVLATAMLSTEEMINQFTRRTFNPSQIVAKVDQRRRENLRELYDYPGHNVTVYSGYSPFVGSGGILGSWSFSVDVGTPADQNTPLEQFGVEELRSHVLDGLRDLRWPQLTIEERLFINGLDLVPNSPLLPHGLKRPVQTVDQPTFEALLAGPDEKMRRYTCIRVSGWAETLVFSLGCASSYTHAASTWRRRAPC
ncbi:hypothetical protein [Candidatus Frankia alpina]|uniref:Uncharacterized protein n=1 Tax=Candidatus Frankia alpina TaxID=2699483 RepID=A0A4S5BQU3_9ACTN|nr:hypothetical protein [Candidatus Frankia alpina]THJ32198.1 hypothetical protein E7Y31_22250 [Candidatus Frankia alpina]